MGVYCTYIKQPKNIELDRRVAAWFANHHGVISRPEALELGLTSDQIRARVRGGGWEVDHRGVYHLAGAPRDELSALRGAVLLGGPSAAVSHGSAAWLWGLTPAPGDPTITVPPNRVARVASVQVVRSRRPLQVVVRQRLPCTTALRTIVDCATVTPVDGLDQLIDTALARRVVDVAALCAVAVDRRLQYYPGRRSLEARLAAGGILGSPHPSVLESRMARLFRLHRLPRPKAEVVWGSNRQYRLDFAYPHLRLAIEVDGWSAHFAPEQQRRDHRRGNALARSGWTVLHYDWWEVTYAGERVAAEIAETYAGLAAAVIS
jgi:very-short-patch-repair endonuclease